MQVSLFFYNFFSYVFGKPFFSWAKLNDCFLIATATLAILLTFTTPLSFYNFQLFLTIPKLQFDAAFDLSFIVAFSNELSSIISQHPHLTQEFFWDENLELALLIQLLLNNLLTYNDCILLLSELNNLIVAVDNVFFAKEFLQKSFEPMFNELFYENYFWVVILKYILRTGWPVLEIPMENIFMKRDAHLDCFRHSDNMSLFTKCDIFDFTWMANDKDYVNAANSLFNTRFNLRYVSFYKFLYVQLLFLSVAVFFIKKKIFIFFLINTMFICFMIINLIWLATASNLIYSLIHFLVFAVLSGLFLIFWGSTYIGICVLLIYGAAIPVLALYIIMLINVDLIQRLFFSEYRENKTFFWLIGFLFLTTVPLALVATTFFDFQLHTKTLYENSYGDLSTFVFYMLLSKWYLNTLSISPTSESIYDLSLNFYSSDLDKVASAAFHFHFNELLALVLLLLIAIIVVIGISWTSKNIDHDFYQTKNIYQKELAYFSTHRNLFTFSLIKWELLTAAFFKKKLVWNISENYQNSFEIMYPVFRENAVTSVGNTAHRDIWYFMVSADCEWYELYGSKRLLHFTKKNNDFEHPVPFGNQNIHPDDYYFWVLHYGLVE